MIPKLCLHEDLETHCSAIPESTLKLRQSASITLPEIRRIGPMRLPFPQI